MSIWIPCKRVQQSAKRPTPELARQLPPPGGAADEDIRYWVGESARTGARGQEARTEDTPSREKMKFLQEQAAISRSRTPPQQKNRIWNCKALAVFIVKMSRCLFCSKGRCNECI